MYVSSAAERVRGAVRAGSGALSCAVRAGAGARRAVRRIAHHELAPPSRASEPMWRIRLTWWREALDEIAKGRPRRRRGRGLGGES